jgi:hypothetical protein
MVRPTMTNAMVNSEGLKRATYLVLAVTVTSRWTACHFDRFQKGTGLFERS